MPVAGSSTGFHRREGCWGTGLRGPFLEKGHRRVRRSSRLYSRSGWGRVLLLQAMGPLRWQLSPLAGYN